MLRQNMSDIGIVEESVSGSCTECSDCLIRSENKTRTKINQKYIKNKGKMKSKHKEKFSERNRGKLQDAVCNKQESLNAPESNVEEKEGITVPISCNCPCIKSYIKFLNTLEMCNCSRKKLKFNNKVTNQDDLIETEKQGSSAIRKEPRLKHWKGTLKIITSSISLPFNLLKLRTNKQNKFSKAKPEYQKIFNEQQCLSENDKIPSRNENTDIYKLGACEMYDDNCTRQNDVRAHQNHSSVSMDRLFHICKRNNFQSLCEYCDETENPSNKEPFKNCKEIRSSIIQDMNAKSSENVANTKIQQRNEFHHTPSEIFSNLNKNDSLNMQHIHTKNSVNILCPLNEQCEIPRKQEIQTKFKGKLGSQLVQKLNSLGNSQRKYVMGNRNNSNHNMKECIDKLITDMENKSGRPQKGFVCNSLQKSDVWIDGTDIPKEISNLKKLLKDKILLHQQECETSLYTCGSSSKVNTQTKSENVKFLEILKSYSDIMIDLETLCEKQDFNQNESSITNVCENFMHVDNSENDCIQPVVKDKNVIIPKITSESKFKVYNENIIEPIVEKSDGDKMTYCKQNFIQENINISDREEILTLDSGDSVQERKISRIPSIKMDTTNDANNTEFRIQGSVNKKLTRSKRRATKAWQENQLTESDTTQSPNT